VNRAAPLVRFVVVAYGRSEGLDAALDSIEGAAAGIAFETVVVLAPGDPAAGRVATRATVLVPEASAVHTPGANRNRGAAGAGAPYLAFADGDVVLEPDFVPRAIAFLSAHPEAGGVGGRIHERQWSAGRLVREITDSYRTRRGGPVEMLATAWIARRTAFEAVGGFDPRLPSEEDMELSLRLARAGHPVHALDLRAAYHDCPPRPSLAEFGRRWRTGLYAGQGVLLRLTWGRPEFVRHLWRQRLYLGAVVFALAGGMAAVAALLGSTVSRTAFAVWLGLALAALLVMAARKGSLSYGALSILAWVVLGLGILNAWLRKPREVRA
jgi:hypothetical protein